MTIGSNWRRWYNSVYKIYPSLYIDKLLNLCWYCWWGGFSPFSLLCCRLPSKNNWRPSPGREKYSSSGQDLICYFINTCLWSISMLLVFNICINKREPIKLFSWLHVLLSYTNIDFFRHINTVFYQIHRSRHNWIFIHQSARWVIVLMIRIVS